MAHHAPRPPSRRSTQVARETAAPRPRWSRFTTTTLATLAAVAVALTGAATAAHADPSVAEIERQIDQDWNKLEPIIEQHNATRTDLAAKRRQADALGKRIARCSAGCDQAMNQVSGLAVQAYKGENMSTVNALLGSHNPSQVVEQLGLLDRFASRQQREVRTVAALRDELAATKAPLDEMVTQLTRTEAQLAAKKKQINTEIDRLQKLRLKVYGNGGGGRCARPLPGRLPRRCAGTAVQVRLRPDRQAVRVGPAEGPNTFDCSGPDPVRLVEGRRCRCRTTPGSSAQVTDRVSRADLSPGDLVFYYSDLHHVGHVRRGRLDGARLPVRSADHDEADRRRADQQLRPPRLRCKEGPLPERLRSSRCALLTRAGARSRWAAAASRAAAAVAAPVGSARCASSARSGSGSARAGPGTASRRPPNRTGARPARTAGRCTAGRSSSPARA